MDMKFPPGFKFGAATSAYQIEGAWNVSDKGENVWDNLFHRHPEVTPDRTNGDVACNSYYLWKTDIQMAHELGLHFYRFSISWTRILPTGFPNRVNKEAVKYYNKLIDGLLQKGIEPVITLYHFDMPLSIHNLGKLSIANNPIWLEPATKEEETLTELAREFAVGRYSHPIYSPHGGWPPAVEKLMKEYSHKKGFPYSRLPSFSEDEKKFIQGTYDYFNLNHYTSRLVRVARPGEVIGFWFLFGLPELGVVLETDPAWALEGWEYLAMKPNGIRRQIAWIKDHYNVSILITETGYASVDPKLNDTGRIEFLQEYLKQVLLAIKEDGADVIGYTYWSLMDNFEWMLGQTIKFGLYHVDFTHPLRTRTPRASAHYYAHIIKHHALDVPVTNHYTYTELMNTGNSCYSLKLLLFVSVFCLFMLK